MAGPESRPIGVFDSGIGGLSVVRALTRVLPKENIVYFGDTARVPYGPKSPQVVREYAAQDTEVLLQHNVKVIVVACNTVSAVALDVVQRRAGIPVVGVIVPGADGWLTYWASRVMPGLVFRIMDADARRAVHKRRKARR